MATVSLKADFSVFNVSCEVTNTCLLITQMQISYMCFYILGIVLSLIIFSSILFNLIYKGSLVRMNWKIIVIICFNQLQLCADNHLNFFSL